MRAQFADRIEQHDDAENADLGQRRLGIHGLERRVEILGPGDDPERRVDAHQLERDDGDEQHEPEFAAPSADAKPKKAPELAEHAGHDEDLRIAKSGRAMDSPPAE